MGSTITITKNPAGKGTVVIRKVGEAHPNDRIGTFCLAQTDMLPPNPTNE